MYQLPKGTIRFNREDLISYYNSISATRPRHIVYPKAADCYPGDAMKTGL